MVNRQAGNLTPTILAGIIIPAEYLPPGELDVLARTLDHVRQADYGRQWVAARNRLDHTPAVRNQRGFTCQHHPDGSASVTQIERLEIGIEHKHQRVHNAANYTSASGEIWPAVVTVWLKKPPTIGSVWRKS